MKNNLLGFFFELFLLYRFRKYVFYGFPIINFCNPGVHYETPCISDPICINVKTSYYLSTLMCGTIWGSEGIRVGFYATVITR